MSGFTNLLSALNTSVKYSDDLYTGFLLSSCSIGFKWVFRFFAGISSQGVMVIGNKVQVVLRVIFTDTSNNTIFRTIIGLTIQKLWGFKFTHWRKKTLVTKKLSAFSESYLMSSFPCIIKCSYWSYF
uniref:Uncharacterized protein n=1 Tax=Cacopsylla melanoneura TaxID=428564 RepID=A0A8D9A1J2_9HEMI